LPSFASRQENYKGLSAHQQEAHCEKVVTAELKKFVLPKPPTSLKDTDAIISYIEDQTGRHHYITMKQQAKNIKTNCQVMFGRK
jgi:hypothetical protein